MDLAQGVDDPPADPEAAAVAVAAAAQPERAAERAAAFAAALAASALTLLPSHIEMALVLIGAAVLVVLAFAVMEPATERAAFGP